MSKVLIYHNPRWSKSRESVQILNELGVEFSDSLNFKYSNTIIRRLSILGWPIGRSLYKQRKIKKELSCA